MAIIFCKENVNPKKKKTTDCVVRAIVSAEEKEWKDVVIKLTNDYALKYCLMPTDKKCFSRFLKDLGYEKLKMPKDENGKKIKIKQYKFEPNAIYIIGIKNHLTCVKKGLLIDSWDCSDYCIINIWKKEG